MRFNKREAQSPHRLPCFRSFLEQSNSIKLLISIVFAIHDSKISMELFVDSVTKINTHTWVKISRNTPRFKDSIIDINLCNKFRTFVYNATLCLHFLFHSDEFSSKMYFTNRILDPPVFPQLPFCQNLSWHYNLFSPIEMWFYFPQDFPLQCNNFRLWHLQKDLWFYWNPLQRYYKNEFLCRIFPHSGVIVRKWCMFSETPFEHVICIHFVLNCTIPFNAQLK